jgi:hypothetical protein
MTAALRVNNGVNETLGISVQVKIMSEAMNFKTHIWAFLTYGGGSCENSELDFSYVVDSKN